MSNSVDQTFEKAVQEQGVFHGYDPGDGNTINIDKMHIVVPLVSAGAETRVLPPPKAVGQKVVLQFFTDGGDIVVSSANGFNQAGADEATFADVGDMLELVGVFLTTGLQPTFRWAVTGDIGSVAIA